MPADRVLTDIADFAIVLRELHAQRRARVISGRKERVRRATLTRPERDDVLRKTGGRCHICGGLIGANDWQADHVLAHSTGGKHSADNFLASHSVCNNYRWHYDAEEFQWILKLGAWMRTQIEKGTPIGWKAGQQFCKYECRRAKRRKPTAPARQLSPASSRRR
jgi:hypothetical protein